MGHQSGASRPLPLVAFEHESVSHDQEMSCTRDLVVVAHRALDGGAALA
jgi:hypothetical protein